MYKRQLEINVFDAKVEFDKAPSDDTEGWTNNTSQLLEVCDEFTAMEEFSDCTVVFGKKGLHGPFDWGNEDVFSAMPLMMHEINSSDSRRSWDTTGIWDYEYTTGPPIADRRAVAFLGPGAMSAPNAGLRMGGIFMPTPLTFQEPEPGQILRSYLERVAYSIKSNLDNIFKVTGGRASSFCLGGSMSKSDVVADALANVLEIPVYRSRDSQVSAMGAAAAAWVSAGEAASLEEAVDMQNPNFDESLPEPLQSAEYLDHYHRWLETFHNITPRA